VKTLSTADVRIGISSSKIVRRSNTSSSLLIRQMTGGSPFRSFCSRSFTEAWRVLWQAQSSGVLEQDKRLRPPARYLLSRRGLRCGQAHPSVFSTTAFLVSSRKVCHKSTCATSAAPRPPSFIEVEKKGGFKAARVSLSMRRARVRGFALIRSTTDFFPK